MLRADGGNTVRSDRVLTDDIRRCFTLTWFCQEMTETTGGSKLTAAPECGRLECAHEVDTFFFGSHLQKITQPDCRVIGGVLIEPEPGGDDEDDAYLQ